jgi:N-carbamoylputrescine amidase
MKLKVTICELESALNGWSLLKNHVKKERSDLVILPEIPAYFWFPSLPEFDKYVW